MLMANCKVKSAMPKCGTKLSLLSGACRRKTALSGICVSGWVGNDITRSVIPTILCCVKVHLMFITNGRLSIVRS